VKQSQTMHSQLQRTKNAITGAAVSIGRVLAPAIESFAHAVKWAADLLAGLDEGTRKWVVGIALLVAAIGPAVMIVGKLAAGFVALKAALATVKVLAVMIGTNLVIAIKTLSVALVTTPIGWIILGITALIGIGYLLVKNWDRVKAFLVSMWEGIKSAIGTFIGWVSSAFSAVVGAAMVVWEPLSGFFGTLWDGITGIFEKAWAKIKAIVDKVTGAVDKVTGAIGKVKSWVWGDDDKKAKRDGDKQGRMVERRAMLASRDPARMLGGQQSNATVTVEFENAPRGLRVDQESSGAMVDLSVGYQMVMP
jgi:phage-related protein